MEALKREGSAADGLVRELEESLGRAVESMEGMKGGMEEMWAMLSRVRAEREAEGGKVEAGIEKMLAWHLSAAEGVGRLVGGVADGSIPLENAREGLIAMEKGGLDGVELLEGVSGDGGREQGGGGGGGGGEDEGGVGQVGSAADVRGGGGGGGGGGSDKEVVTATNASKIPITLPPSLSSLSTKLLQGSISSALAQISLHGSVFALRSGFGGLISQVCGLALELGEVRGELEGMEVGGRGGEADKEREAAKGQVAKLAAMLDAKQRELEEREMAEAAAAKERGESEEERVRREEEAAERRRAAAEANKAEETAANAAKALVKQQDRLSKGQEQVRMILHGIWGLGFGVGCSRIGLAG